MLSISIHHLTRTGDKRHLLPENTQEASKRNIPAIQAVQMVSSTASGDVGVFKQSTPRLLEEPSPESGGKSFEFLEAV